MFDPNWSPEGDKEIRKQFMQDAVQYRLAASVRAVQPHREKRTMCKLCAWLGSILIAWGGRLQKRYIDALTGGIVEADPHIHTWTLLKRS